MIDLTDDLDDDQYSNENDAKSNHIKSDEPKKLLNFQKIVENESQEDDSIEILTPVINKTQSPLTKSPYFSNNLSNDDSIFSLKLTKGKSPINSPAKNITFSIQKEQRKEETNRIEKIEKRKGESNYISLKFDDSAEDSSYASNANESINLEEDDEEEIEVMTPSSVDLKTESKKMQSNSSIKKKAEINDQNENISVKKKLNFNQFEKDSSSQKNRKKVEFMLVDKKHFSTYNKNFDLIFCDFPTSNKLENDEWIFGMSDYENLLETLKCNSIEYDEIPAHILKYIKQKEEDVEGKKKKKIEF